MAIQPKSNGLITENAQQYYQGSQGFRAAASGVNQKFVTDFCFRRLYIIETWFI